MKTGPVALGVASLPIPRYRQAVGAPEAVGRDTSAPRLTPALPGAVADRLAGLLAADPGLAEVVCAQLPAARLASARDFAAYSPSSVERTHKSLDITT